MIAVHNKKTWSTSTTAEILLSRWVTQTMNFSCVPSFFVAQTSHKSRMHCVPLRQFKSKLLFLVWYTRSTWTDSDVMLCHFCAHAFCRQRASTSFRWQLAFAAHRNGRPIRLGPHSLQALFFNHIRRRSRCLLYTGAVLSQVLQRGAAPAT